MSEKVIRYGAGGVPYVEKKSEAPKEEVKKEEVISDILTKNPNKEDKKDKKKD